MPTLSPILGPMATMPLEHFLLRYDVAPFWLGILKAAVGTYDRDEADWLAALTGVMGGAITLPAVQAPQAVTLLGDFVTETEALEREYSSGAVAVSVTSSLAVAANSSSTTAADLGRRLDLVAVTFSSDADAPVAGTLDIHGKADLSDRPQASFTADGLAGTEYRGPAVPLNNADSPRLSRVYLRITNPTGAPVTYKYVLSALRLEA